MIPMISLYDYFVKLRDESECRDVQISYDSNLDALIMTLRYADHTRRFTFAGQEILCSTDDYLLPAAAHAFVERTPREGV